MEYEKQKAGTDKTWPENVFSGTADKLKNQNK